MSFIAPVFLPATCSVDGSSPMPSPFCSVPRAREALVCVHVAGRGAVGRAQGVKTWCGLSLGCHHPGVAGISCFCLLAAYLFLGRSLASGPGGGPAIMPAELLLLVPKSGLWAKAWSPDRGHLEERNWVFFFFFFLNTVLL